VTAAEVVAAPVRGFREHAGWALASDTLEFVDLEDISGVFRETATANRTRFANRAGRMATASPAVVFATGLARTEN